MHSLSAYRNQTDLNECVWWLKLYLHAFGTNTASPFFMLNYTQIIRSIKK